MTMRVMVVLSRTASRIGAASDNRNVNSPDPVARHRCYLIHTGICQFCELAKRLELPLPVSIQNVGEGSHCLCSY